MSTRKQEILESKAKFLASQGYKVFVTTGRYAYGYYHDEANIGYFQIDDLTHCVNFSTIHKACKAHGTGFGDCEDHIDGLRLAPNWYKGRMSDIKKYKPEEFEAFLNEKHRDVVEVIV